MSQSNEKPNGPSPIMNVIRTVHRLRAPGGCPWDRKQTHQSLRPYLTEEAHEVLEVLDQIGSVEDLKKEPIRNALREELGDVLMQVLLHAEMASEAGAFDFQGVAAALDEKLIRRHPHVFGETKVDGAEGVLVNWEKIKAEEKAAGKSGAVAASSALDGIPKGLPALQKAAKVIEKVTRVGFQWNDMQGPLAKLDEELAEMKAEVRALEEFIRANGKDADATALRHKLEGEIGDLLFSLANVAYLMKVNPEDALRSTLARFEARFKFVERKLREAGKAPEQSDLEEMDRFWEEAKREERGSGRA